MVAALATPVICYLLWSAQHPHLLAGAFALGTGMVVVGLVYRRRHG